MSEPFWLLSFGTLVNAHVAELRRFGRPAGRLSRAQQCGGHELNIMNAHSFCWNHSGIRRGFSANSLRSRCEPALARRFYCM